MRLIGVIFLVFALSGCAPHKQAIDACHDRVHSQAKYQAEIVSTEAWVGHAYDGIQVKGRAKLQNGFGAWSNYTYYCRIFNKTSIGKFELKEGY